MTYEFDTKLNGFHIVARKENQGALFTTYSNSLLMCRPSIQPSLLDNLQQRLDTLPIPDVFNGSQRFQETAAGMERSPSLRVRPFSHQPTQRQGRHPAAVSRAAAQPSNMFMRRNQPTAQLHAARQPVLESNAAMHQSPGPVQGYASNGHQAEQWHLDDLPDTPEAPRAATAAQNQAVADALFDTAVSESALGQGGLPAEPSWLHDAAAYDTAAAELDTDGLDALEILSDDDDNDSASMPGITSAAGSSLALTSLDQLVLSSDSEDDSVVADSIDVPASSSATPQHARLRLLQQVLRSGAAAEQHAPALPASSATAASAAAVHMSSGLLLGSTEQLAPDVIDLAGSPPPTAAGHDSMQRTALSDVTSSFPAEQQQQQADQPADAPVADKPFTLQRRRRPVCREPTQCIIADQLASSSSAVIALSAADPDSSVVEFEAQSAQDYAAAAQPAGQSTNAGAAAVSPVAVARCTRSQARRNHHPNVSQQGLAQPESLEAPKPQSNDDAVVSQDGRAELPDSHSQAVSSNRQHAQVQQTGINRPQRTVKNRPRLQLNRAARHE